MENFTGIFVNHNINGRNLQELYLADSLNDTNRPFFFYAAEKWMVHHLFIQVFIVIDCQESFLFRYNTAQRMIHPKTDIRNPAVSPGVRYISFISCSPAESGSAIIIKFALISFVSLPSTYAVNPSEYGMERQRSFGEERFMVPVIRLVEKEALSLCRSRFSKTSFPRESAESAYCSIGWHTIPSSSKR